MPDFDEVAAPALAPVAIRDKRRPKRIVVDLDENREVVGYEIQHAGYSSVDGELVEKDGANRYTGANAKALATRTFKAGARAEIAARMATDQVDADGEDAPTEVSI